MWSFADGTSWDFRDRTRVVGILNVTPDSFSDGGLHARFEDAVTRGLAMAEEGADAIDIGGESTRPGSLPVPDEEERRRVVPVIRALRQRLAARPGPAPTDPPRGMPSAASGGSPDGDRIRISVDTSKAAVAEAALEAGAEVVNDVTGLRGDPRMAPLLAGTGAAAILMHMRGTPRTMQDSPRYENLMGEIAEFLRGSLDIARRAGIPDERIVIDPGIGFGKTAEQSFEILASLQRLAALGRPILVGASRKSFLGWATGLPVEQRLEASLAAGAAAILNGASLLRVHDIAATLRMVRVIDALHRAAGGSA